MRNPKTAVVRPQGHVNADINVTPLVDVVLVLLIILMVVTPSRRMIALRTARWWPRSTGRRRPARRCWAS